MIVSFSQSQLASLRGTLDTLIIYCSTTMLSNDTANQHGLAKSSIGSFAANAGGVGCYRLAFTYNSATSNQGWSVTVGRLRIS